MLSKPRRMSRLRQRLPESLAWLEEAEMRCLDHVDLAEMSGDW